MKLTVSSTNEFKFYPDIANNLELKESERFTIVVRKLNQVLTSTQWTNFDADGGVDVDLVSKVKAHVVRIDNPPMLQIDGNGKEELLVIDDLVNSKYPELFDITTQLVQFINTIQGTGNFETKKS